MMRSLQITEANHDDNTFYYLGLATFANEGQLLDGLQTIPAFKHDCDNDNKCYMLDILDDQGDIVDDREISKKTALKLLGVKKLGKLRAQAKQYNEALASNSGLDNTYTGDKK